MYSNRQLPWNERIWHDVIVNRIASASELKWWASKQFQYIINWDNLAYLYLRSACTHEVIFHSELILFHFWGPSGGRVPWDAAHKIQALIRHYLLPYITVLILWDRMLIFSIYLHVRECIFDSIEEHIYEAPAPISMVPFFKKGFKSFRLFMFDWG